MNLRGACYGSQIYARNPAWWRGWTTVRGGGSSIDRNVGYGFRLALADDDPDQFADFDRRWEKTRQPASAGL